jgi:hypothetical protein
VLVHVCVEKVLCDGLVGRSRSIKVFAWIFSEATELSGSTKGRQSYVTFGVLGVREETCFVPSVNSSKCVCTQVFNSCTVKEKRIESTKELSWFRLLSY